MPPAAAFVRAGIGGCAADSSVAVTPLDELEREFEPAWRRALRRAGVFVVDGLVASAVVWLAALPLVAMRFHLVSPIGVILNIPLIPVHDRGAAAGGRGSCALVDLGAAGRHRLPGARPCLLKLTKAIVLWGVEQPWGHRFVVGPAWGWVLVFYVVLVLAVLARTQGPRSVGSLERRCFRAVPWWLLAAWVAPGWLFSAALTSRVRDRRGRIPVGRAWPGGAHPDPGRPRLLYDCGRLGDPSVGRRIVAPALWERGVGRIDAVFLSHADQDHYNGLLDLLDRFPIGVVRITPGFGGEANPSAIDLLRRIKSARHPDPAGDGARIVESRRRVVHVRHPPAGWDPEASDNARSIVLDVAFAGRHMLLTGDLELSGLDALVAQPRPRPAAGSDSRPPPRRQGRQPGMALRMGQAAGRHCQPATTVLGGQRSARCHRTIGNPCSAGPGAAAPSGSPGSRWPVVRDRISGRSRNEQVARIGPASGRISPQARFGGTDAAPRSASGRSCWWGWRASSSGRSPACSSR